MMEDDALRPTNSGAPPREDALSDPAAAQPDAAASGVAQPETFDPPAETLFEQAALSEAEAFQLTLGSYEGPLDLLLDLARRQKVDLLEISVLALAEQYLAFVQEARRLKLSIAADYLVMAAWIAFLKSRMLLPKPPEEDEADPEDLQQSFIWRMRRLEAMQRASETLFQRAQLDRDFFARGEPERLRVKTRVEYHGTVLELLRAYARQKTKEQFQPLHLDRRSVVAIDEALARLRPLIGDAVDWMRLSQFLPEEWKDDDHARSALASAVAATLELAKHGHVTIRQDGLFGPIFVMRRDAPQETELSEALAEPPEEERRRPRRRRGDGRRGDERKEAV